MGETTAITWADSTFNIAIGCEKISEGCENCYAERDMENPKYGRRFKDAWGPEGFRYPLSDAYWKKPLSWNRKAQKEGRRIRVFASSLCDVFERHALIDRERSRLFDLVQQTPNLDWMLLTKRIDRAAEVWPWKSREEAPRNLWIGVTAENQTRADERIPLLMQTPAARRFVSCEPMLGPINVRARLCLCQGNDPFIHRHYQDPPHACARCSKCNGYYSLDWVICGGETGPAARPMHPDWVRSLRDQCQAAGVPFHFKQWGEYIYPSQMSDDLHAKVEGSEAGIYANHAYWIGKKKTGHMIDGREWLEFPEVKS